MTIAESANPEFLPLVLNAIAPSEQWRGVSQTQQFGSETMILLEAILQNFDRLQLHFRRGGCGI